MQRQQMIATNLSLQIWMHNKAPGFSSQLYQPSMTRKLNVLSLALSYQAKMYQASTQKIKFMHII